MKALKITNIGYFDYWFMGQHEHVKDLAQYLHITGLPYYTLANYFANTIQRGGDLIEFWVAADELEGSRPYAFAHWAICGPPHIGKVTMDYIYSWSKGKKGGESVRLLLEQFEKFARYHKAPYIKAGVINQKVFRAISWHANKMGYEVVRHEYIDFELVKKPGDIKEKEDARRGRGNQHGNGQHAPTASNVGSAVADPKSVVNVGNGSARQVPESEQHGVSTDGSDVRHRGSEIYAAGATNAADDASTTASEAV